MTTKSLRHDRALLLHGSKRDAVLQLWEVQRYGMDSYGNADYVSLYGMGPEEWHARGVRVLGRTAVECTRDELGNAIGREVAAAAAKAQHPVGLVIDACAGSGNTLYWLLRHLPGVRGLGFETDAGVYRLTQQNLAALAPSIEILNVDYQEALPGVAVAAGQVVVMFVAPPWGDALGGTGGLDLSRTSPPVSHMVEFAAQTLRDNPLLFAVQVHESVTAASLAQLRARFDWSALSVYALNAPGENHGVLLGSMRWAPGQ